MLKQDKLKEGAIILLIMDPADFEGIHKWKFLVPMVYIVNWSLVVVGPLLFPYVYQIICMTVIVYSVLKTLGLCLGTFVSLLKLKSSLNLLNSENAPKPKLQQSYYHAIVIPSYKQSQSLLLDTLNVLARSPRAKNQLIVFLAMEAHEQNSDTKAQSIIQKVKSNFFYAGFTQHQIREGEAKGKASNVSWCVEHMQQQLTPQLVDMNKVIITILDADSWAPKQYFEMLEWQLSQRPHIKDVCVFSAPQIYTRNHLEVPVFNRTFDTMHSLVQLSNLVALKFSFPLSNYSVSYNLMKRIGWWDTCADAIGEDFHTCQKSFWKVEETMYTVPIYIPFNQVSLSTGEGYCKDIAARFWQAERHTRGVSDVAYSCHMLFNTPFKFRNLWMTLLVIEVFTMAAVIPWALLGLGLQYKLMNDTSIHYFPGWLIEVLLNAATVFTFVSYIFYECWRRESNSRVYGQKNDAWWRIFEYPIIFTFALFGFSIPSFILASFAVLCTTTEYRVAQKNIQKAKSLEKKPSASKPKSMQKKNSLLKSNSLKSDYRPVAKNNKIANQMNISQNNLEKEKEERSEAEIRKNISTADHTSKTSKTSKTESNNMGSENGSRGEAGTGADSQRNEEIIEDDEDNENISQDSDN